VVNQNLIMKGFRRVLVVVEITTLQATKATKPTN